MAEDNFSEVMKQVREEVHRKRQEEFQASNQMTLGELRTALVQYRGYSVRFDTGHFPGKLQSWRGSYEESALEHTEEHQYSYDVDGLLEDIEAALGDHTAPPTVFQGWKGGEYTFNRFTPVWVANRGESSYDEEGSRGVTGVTLDENDGMVIIHTQEMEY